MQQQLKIFMRRFLHEARAAVLIEFAFALPVLLILFFGVYEVSRYLLYRERLESSATQMLDLITRETNVTAESLESIFSTFSIMMEPYQATDARIIVTQIVKPVADCQPVALWQYMPGGSKIAPAVGKAANLGEIQLLVGDNVMAIEVMATYQPIESNGFVGNLIGSYSQYVSSFGHTRYGTFNIDPVSKNVVTAACVP